jgi:hypothetical protein
MSHPLISILNGFGAAAAGVAPVEEWTEREIHPFEDRPVGLGWVRIGTDAGYGIWERHRVTPTAEAMADMRAWQRNHAR